MQKPGWMALPAALVPLMLLFCLPAFGQSRGEKAVVRVSTDAGQSLDLYRGSYALVIGVSNYTAGWPILESVPREVKLVSRALGKLGFKVTQVMDPDAEQLEDAFDDFIERYGYLEGNRLLFFYSGHGYSPPGSSRGFLVPADAPSPSRDRIGFKRKALPMTQIMAWAREMDAKHSLFLFDSCFSGTVFQAKSRPVPRHISAKTAHPVRQFISAGSANQEVPAKSVFAPALIQALEGEADRSPEDGYVSGSELGEYLLEKVTYYNRSQTPQYGKIRDPELDQGDFVFVLAEKAPAVTRPVPPPAPAPAPDRTQQAAPPAPSSDIADLHVTTEPGQAVIYLNGERKGRAPQTFQMIPAGSYKLMARKGYLVANQDVDLARDDFKRVNLKLEHEKGDLRLFSQPSGAMLNLDGKQYSATPVSIKGLKAGSHKVVLNKMQGGDFYEYQGELLIKPGGNRQTLQLVKSQIPQRINNSLGQEFVLIQPGSFEMGSNNNGYSDEKPVHRVRISKPYYLQTTEVTQGQWRSVMDSNPSNFKGDDLPVEQVSWNAVQEFIRKLNAKEGSNQYRLPTEAEWEYAARAGSSTAYCFGDDAGRLGEYAWYDSNSGNKTPAIGQKKPNSWGLYDMHGNVWEWVQDWYGSYSSGSSTDPSGPSSGSDRVARGGSWCLPAVFCRSAQRGGSDPGDRDRFAGFRLARGL